MYASVTGPAADLCDGDALRSIPIDEACKLLACSSRTLWRAVDAGLLPEPARLGRKSAWPLQTLLSFRASACRRRRRHTAERDRDDRGRYVPADEPSATECQQ